MPASLHGAIMGRVRLALRNRWRRRPCPTEATSRR